MDHERRARLGVRVEGSVHGAFGGGFASWLLSNVYLAAQMAVLPGSLLFPTAAPRRSTGACATP